MKGCEVVPGDGEQPDTPRIPPALTFRRASPLLQGQDGLGGDKEGQRARLEEGQPGGTEGCLHPGPGLGRGPAGAAALPDAHGGLDEGGDAHAGEDGADEVADGELVLAHAQALGQQEGDGDGAAEAGQVVLGAQLER